MDTRMLYEKALDEFKEKGPKGLYLNENKTE